MNKEAEKTLYSSFTQVFKVTLDLLWKGFTERSRLGLKGKEKMIASMTNGLHGGFPVVIPYTGIFLRDHWDKVTDQPWWAINSWDIAGKLKAEGDMLDKIGIDWVACGLCAPREWRETHRVELHGERVLLVNATGDEVEEVRRPPVGGAKSRIDEVVVRSIEDVDREVAQIEYSDLIQTGRLDYVKTVVERFGSEKFVVASVASPLWETYHYMGFRGTLLNLFKTPRLVEYLLKKLAARDHGLLKAYAEAGVDGVWIEECLCSADVISLASFKRYVLPYVEELIEEIKRLKMKSIYYPCGDVHDRLEMMVEAGPDCISLEESKKGFKIDITWVDKVAAGKACIFGNLDAIKVLQNGSYAELEREIKRQLEVGCNYGKFVMSLGSPVTPGTPVERVREYVEIARKYQCLQRESNS